jgi:hypothetical protein
VARHSSLARHSSPHGTRRASRRILTESLTAASRWAGGDRVADGYKLARRREEVEAASVVAGSRGPRVRSVAESSPTLPLQATSEEKD